MLFNYSSKFNLFIEGGIHPADLEKPVSSRAKEEDRQICLEKNDISPRAMINDVRRAEKRDTVTSVRLEETTDVYTNREQANAFVSILSFFSFSVG